MVQEFTTLTSLIVHPAAHHLAFIRTLTLCAVALALAFSGAHWRRLELTRLGFAVLVLLAVKLVAEDLRHGHLGYTAASICLVAFTLIAVPRVGHTRPAT
jgi:predicted tellurium resistance membrane protein TerC